MLFRKKKPHEPHVVLGLRSWLRFEDGYFVIGDDRVLCSHINVENRPGYIETDEGVVWQPARFVLEFEPSTLSYSIAVGLSAEQQDLISAVQMMRMLPNLNTMTGHFTFRDHNLLLSGIRGVLGTIEQYT